MPVLTSPCCVYGNPCFSVCINPKCKKLGTICQKGYQSKQQCFLFHQECPQIKWSQLQKITQQNLSTSTQQFLQFKLKMQQIFIKCIIRIKEQQQKFRIWAKTFGHSLEVMKFIKLIHDKNYEDVSGSIIAPVVSSYFKEENNISRPPQLIEEEIKEVQNEIQDAISGITSLYLRTGKHKAKQQHSMMNIPSGSATSIPDENQKHLSLSQNNYSTKRDRQNSQIKIKNTQKSRIKNQLTESNLIIQNDAQIKGVLKDLLSKSRQQQVMQRFNSKIYRQVDNIKNMFINQKPVSFNLLFRASQHDFSTEEFHKVCDNIPHTLVLIETQFGQIIGGYSVMEWKSNKKQWVADKSKNSFIFSLSSNQRYELNLPQFAISCNSQKGPIFGCCDICIVNKSNKERSSAEFPISYNLNKKYSRGDQACLAFTGHPKGQFKTKEWEVFKVEFQ